MPFQPHAPITESNPLPIVHGLPDGSFDKFAPIQETNPLPIIATEPPAP